ncbi:undecaprenyl-diphosphatase [Sphingomonas sp. F9_3S_D5_B_2]
MTPVGAIPTGVFAALIVALLLLWFGMLLIHDSAPDRAVLNEVYAGRWPNLAAVAQSITALGTPPLRYVVPIVAALLLAWKQRIVPAALALVVPTSGNWVVNQLKPLLALGRPPEDLHLMQTSTFAFPSGHTASATMAYLSAALLLAGRGSLVGGARWGLAAALIMSFAVGLSRAMLGVHWPTDVIGGWAFGGFWTLVTLRGADAASRRLAVRDLLPIG